jgi:hypothetical protein
MAPFFERSAVDTSLDRHAIASSSRKAFSGNVLSTVDANSASFPLQLCANYRDRGFHVFYCRLARLIQLVGFSLVHVCFHRFEVRP